MYLFWIFKLVYIIYLIDMALPGQTFSYSWARGLGGAHPLGLDEPRRAMQHGWE